jgi:hypothetical protein
MEINNGKLKSGWQLKNILYGLNLLLIFVLIIDFTYKTLKLIKINREIGLNINIETIYLTYQPHFVLLILIIIVDKIRKMGLKE